MEKKWLCLLVAFLLLLLPLSGLNQIEQRELLARALTATAGAASDEAMMALGSVAMNHAGSGDVQKLGAALDEAGFTRGFRASERAKKAAQALLGGERTLTEDVLHFTKSTPENEHTRIGTFYFY